jgi:hypothetical protein
MDVSEVVSEQKAVSKTVSAICAPPASLGDGSPAV